jgi:hypothetical protein
VVGDLPSPVPIGEWARTRQSANPIAGINLARDFPASACILAAIANKDLRLDAVRWPDATKTHPAAKNRSNSCYHYYPTDPPILVSSGTSVKLFAAGKLRPEVIQELPWRQAKQPAFCVRPYRCDLFDSAKGWPQVVPQ